MCCKAQVGIIQIDNTHVHYTYCKLCGKLLEASDNESESDSD